MSGYVGVRGPDDGEIYSGVRVGGWRGRKRPPVDWASFPPWLCLVLLPLWLVVALLATGAYFLVALFFCTVIFGSPGGAIAAGIITAVTVIIELGQHHPAVKNHPAVARTRKGA